MRAFVRQRLDRSHYGNQQQKSYYGNQQQQRPYYWNRLRPYYRNQQQQPYYGNQQRQPYYGNQQQQPYYGNQQQQQQPYYGNPPPQPKYGGSGGSDDRRQTAQPPPSAPPAPAVQVVGEHVPNEVMITTSLAGAQALEDSVTRDYRLQLIERLDVDLLNRRILRMRIADGRSVGTVLAALGSDSRMEDSQPNYLYRHQAGAPGIGQANPQYALGKIEIKSAHGLAQGRGAIVAIIDSAVDLTHPDLRGGIAQSYDAVGDADPNPDPHGTAIAGIIRAQGAMLGVAPLANLLCVRVFTPKLARDPAASTNALLRGLDWSIKQGARVINLSFVGPRDPLVYKALKAAFNDKQAIIVAPAGNGGENAPPAYPGAYKEVIAVTATDQSDRLYKQANRGSYIAIAAPGVDVLAPTLGSTHEQKTGTSFAAAHVSGIVALMLERNPQLSPNAVRRALMAAAQRLGGRGNDFGAGRANAFKTLKMIGQAVKAKF